MQRVTYHDGALCPHDSSNCCLRNGLARFIYKKPETFEESVAIYQLAVKTIRQKKTYTG